MADTQHFCLRWNNYQSSITSAFENLRDDEDFVDVTLACDGRSLKAHRVVLSACSPYFRELLKSTPCKHPVIVLQDVAFTDLHALVEFIYHGEVNVHQRSLSSFLKTAEVLRVSGLTQQQAEDSHNLADIQRLANTGGRTPINPHHQSFADKMVEDAMFNQGASPPPHLHPTANGAAVNQLLRRAAAAAAMRRERHNSTHSDELLAAAAAGATNLKRQRSAENGLQPGSNNNSNNNSPDVISHMPQVTPTDFSTIKHNIINHNNNHHHLHQHHHLQQQQQQQQQQQHHTGSGGSVAGTGGSSAGGGGLLKEAGEHNSSGLGPANQISNINNNNNNNNNGGGSGNGGSNGNNNGLSGSFTDKDNSLTPSPPNRLGSDDVKSEPMDMVCGSSGSGSASSIGGGGNGGGLPAGSVGLSLSSSGGLIGMVGGPNGNGMGNNNNGSSSGIGGGSASTNPASDDHSNDSSGENDPKYMGIGGDGKGSLSLFLPPYVRSSNNDDDIDTSIHSHTAPPSFLMSPNDSKLFSQPGFGFSMAALGADPGSLVGLNSQFQSAADLAGSPQDSEGPTSTTTAAAMTTTMTTITTSTPTTKTSLLALERSAMMMMKMAKTMPFGEPQTEPHGEPVLDFSGQTSDAITILVTPDHFHEHYDDDNDLGNDERDDHDHDTDAVQSYADLADDIDDLDNDNDNDQQRCARQRRTDLLHALRDYRRQLHHSHSHPYHPPYLPQPIVDGIRTAGNGCATSSHVAVASVTTSVVATKATATAASSVAPAGGLASKVCPVCNKTFSRAWSLQRHMTDRHFYVPQHLECDICGRTYRSRNSLISHKSQYHGAGVSSKVVVTTGGSGSLVADGMPSSAGGRLRWSNN